MEVALADALLLWNPGLNGNSPAFAVRPIGHPDYDQFSYKVGACFTSWRKMAKENPGALKLKAMIHIWHVVDFYGVPAQMVHEAMLCIPEYRDMLADDCLPVQFRHERD